jgi:CRISPR-associated protein Csm1
MELTTKEYGQIYTVFSGGDDFFLVGPWNKAIDFAGAIRRDFTAFCADNPDLTFSSGVVMAKPHEPLSFCAERVDNKLQCSKRHKGKDRITLFDQTVSWDDLKVIMSEASTVIRWLQSQPQIVSRAFAYHLLRYGDMADKSGIFMPEAEIETAYLKFVPLLVYDIGRNLAKPEQSEAYAWAASLLPTSNILQASRNLPFLRTIMQYVLTYEKKMRAMRK